MNALWEVALLVVALLFAGVLLTVTTICERRLDAPATMPSSLPLDLSDAVAVG